MAHTPERMKMKTRHIVPLSREAMEVFRELHAKTGRLQHVFPGLVNRKRTMSDAVNSKQLTVSRHAGQRSVCRETNVQTIG